MADLTAIEKPLEKYKSVITRLVENLSSEDLSEIESNIHRVLVARSVLHTVSTKNPLSAAQYAPEIAKLDRELRKQGRVAIETAAIDLSIWRNAIPDSTELEWWWYLDSSTEIDNAITIIFNLLTIVFVGAALSLALLVTQRLSSSGLEFAAGISLATQILIGGGLISSTGRDLVLKLFRRIPNFQKISGRATFIASLLFFVISLLVYIFAIPATARLLHEEGIRALEQENLTRARFYLETAARLEPTHASSLTQLGILYETLGQYEAAQASFEEALDVDSRLVFNHYRLAELYITRGDIAEAMKLLDHGIELIREHMADTIELPFENNDQAKQAHYLLLVSRARAFLAVEDAGGALVDLQEAKRLVESEPDLFVTLDNKESPPSGALRTVELHLYFARAFELEDQSANADRSWRNVQALADINSSRERLWLSEARTNLE